MEDTGTQKPLVVVFICDEEFLDVEGGRVDLLKAYYESQGYRVRLERLPAVASWLADRFAGPHLLHMCQSALREAVLVHVEAHLGCGGLRDKFLEEKSYVFADPDEEALHTDDLRNLVDPLQAWMRKLGNQRAQIVTILYDLVTAKQHGVFEVTGPA